MSATGLLRVEIDGRPPTVEALQRLALTHQGHFTAAQVRGRRVRGLGLHLARLEAASQELFGIGLDRGRVRELVLHALGSDLVDASLRVIVFASETAGELSVLVTLRPPGGVAEAPQRLRSVGYQRALAHVKHIGSFDWSHHQRMAERDGYDGVLLTDHEGVVSEAGIANIGFLAGGEVVWPDAPSLQGITMQLVEPRLAGAGLPTRRRCVQLAEISMFDAAFVTNARGIAAVCLVDEMQLPVDNALMTRLHTIYEDVPWDALEA